MNKLTSIIGCVFCIAFLIGLATTLTRSMMIGFKDVLPVYILMVLVIVMMLYEAFGDKKKIVSFLIYFYLFSRFLWHQTLLLLEGEWNMSLLYR